MQIVGYSREELIERLETNSIPEPNTGCQLWLKADNGNGYGVMGLRKSGQRMHYVHRVAYMVFKGDIPDDLEIDHSCGVRSCINPYHLRVVTHHENMLLSNNTIASIHLQKTHCYKGHPFSSENTYLLRGGGRQCLTCRRAFDKKRGKRRGVQR